jgi:hypothetical protein
MSETVVMPRRRGIAIGSWIRRPQLVAAATGAGAALAVTAVAAWARWKALGAPMWIDEGISIGIASHPIAHIPGLLRLDGSPPLYYLLLHWWMRAFGRSATRTHELSVLFAVLSAPAALWAGWSVFGRRAGLLAGGLASLSPFVGLYADETRMYSLVFLLAVLATGAWLHAFVLRRRRWLLAFAVLLAALLYTHGWAAFLTLGFGVATLALLAAGPDRARLLLDAVLAFGGAGLAFAPWLPTALFQAAHTGAPWSHAPRLKSLLRALSAILGGRAPEALLLTVGGVGALLTAARGQSIWRRGIGSLLVLSLTTLAAAWLASRLATPAWALRYLVIVLAPGLLLIAAGLDRAGPAGIAAAAVAALLFWLGTPHARTLSNKSNVEAVALRLGDRMPAGTVVASAQPEQVPLLRYYLPAGMRYVTPMGRVADPTVMDWRDALARLRHAPSGAELRRLVAHMRPGQRILLVRPLFKRPSAPWTRIVARRGRQWRLLLLHDRLLRRIASVRPRHGNNRVTVAAILLQRR